MTTLNERVMQALSTVIEPELNRDIVSLDMVRDLKVEDGIAEFTIVLTTPACPLKGCLRRALQCRADWQGRRDQRPSYQLGCSGSN